MKTIGDEVIIRKHKSSDLFQVKELFIAGMQDSNAPDSYIQNSLGSDLSRIDDTYFSGRGSFFVMQRLSDATIVGTVGLEDLSLRTKPDENETVDEDENFCELRRMSVHSSERRKGRGKQLVEFFIRYARDNGFDGIKLTTGSWMDHAISFYLSVGFKDDGRMEYDHNGVKVIIAKLSYSLS